MPTVSIGMPAYNAERFIREALDSLLSQSFGHFELIISDNASTDATGAICGEYATRDQRIRYFRQSENCGVVNNFEFVLNEARGEYFMWTACDDMVASPDYLKELVKVIANGYDLVFPSFDFVRTENDGTLHVLKQDVMRRCLKCKTREDYCVASIYLDLQFYGLFRRTSLLDNYSYARRARKRLGFDCFFVQVISAKLRLCYVPSVTKLYRFHPNQISKALAPFSNVVDYIRLSGMCVRFWLWESNTPLFTKGKVLLALAGWNGYGVIRRTLSALKSYARGQMLSTKNPLPER
jgi:glycosyltransferase involved in cell wall biosynthesis